MSVQVRELSWGEQEAETFRDAEGASMMRTVAQRSGLRGSSRSG